VDDPAAVFEAAHGTDAKARLRANTERAMALGIFSAPSFTTAGETILGQ